MKLVGKPYSWRDWLLAFAFGLFVVLSIAKFDPDHLYIVIIIFINVTIISLVKMSFARSRQKERDAKLKKLYKDLIKQAHNIVDRSLKTIHTFQEMKKISNEPISAFFYGVISDLHYFIAGTEYVAELAERRILKEEKIPNPEKVFSLFEPDTELINRGKRPYPIEFGHRVLLIQDSAGFIIHSHVMDIGFTDEKVIVEIKARETVSRIDTAQTLTYLRLSETKLALIINFHEPLLKDGEVA